MLNDLLFSTCQCLSTHLELISSLAHAHMFDGSSHEALRSGTLYLSLYLVLSISLSLLAGPPDLLEILNRNHGELINSLLCFAMLNKRSRLAHTSGPANFQTCQLDFAASSRKLWSAQSSGTLSCCLYLSLSLIIYIHL